MTPAEAYLSEQEAEAHGGLFHPHLEAVPLPEKSSGSVSLRTYQKNAVSSVLREFKGDIANGKEPVKKTLCVMATGTGKSLCIAELVRKAQINKHPVLVMVHRKELIEQLAEKINRFGVPTLKERAEENAIAGFGEPPFGVANVVIASTATLKGDRLQQWERNSFKLIISDECFPAGTLVDGKPIENIEIGEMVKSYNHETGMVERQRVIRLFKNPVKQLVKVNLSNGENIVCTPEHPFAVFQDDKVVYIPARKMAGKYIIKRKPVNANATRNAVVSHVQYARRKDFGKQLEIQQAEDILREGMQQQIPSKSFICNDVKNESQICVGANENQQSYGEAWHKRESLKKTKRNELETNSAGRQRARRNGTATNVIWRAGLAYGSLRKNRMARRGRTANASNLQNRYSEYGIKSCDRSRREFAQSTFTGCARQKENGIFRGARVDSVEILESGSDGRFGGLCSDSFVYNIEVERNHNYFVNDVLVHNCHHVVSPGQMAILEHFGVMENHTRLVGFTATADRLDGKGLIQAFDSLAFEYNLEAAINDPEGPFLAKPVAYTIETDPPIDLKDLRIVAGDFNKGDLERKINDNIGTLVNALIDSGHLGDKKFICFTPDVASAHAVAAALDDVGIKAKAVSGKTEDTERQNIIDEYKTGAIQGMINCMIFTEGFDAPETEAIVILRPTKSRSLYSQMVGRGTRPKANGGECSVIDFAYMTGTHQLVSSVDLYDNKDIDDAVIDRAREIVKEKKQIDPKEAIEEAQAEFDLSERVRIERRVAKLRVKKFDLVTTYDLLGIKDKAGQQWGDTKAATPKMIKFAQNCGVDLHEGAGFGTTKKILDTLSTRRKYGLSTMKQVATCIRLSHQKDMNIRPEEFRKMKFEEASAFIGQHKTW